MSGRPVEEVDTQPGVVVFAKWGFGNSAWSTVRSASRNSGGPELGPGADLPGGEGSSSPGSACSPLGVTAREAYSAMVQKMGPTPREDHYGSPSEGTQKTDKTW